MIVRAAVAASGIVLAISMHGAETLPSLSAAHPAILVADPDPATPTAPEPPEADQPPKADQPPNPDQPAPTPPAAPKPPPTSPTEGLTSVLGKDVKANGSTDSIGKIDDILIDGTGSVSAAVIDVGGFLGVGSRKIAVEWHLLHFDPADTKIPITIDMDRAALQAAPEYAASKQMIHAAPPDDAAAPPSPLIDPAAPAPTAPDTADNKAADGPK